jgi:hypothetical protein
MSDQRDIVTAGQRRSSAGSQPESAAPPLPIVHVEPQLATSAGHFARFAFALARACRRAGRRYAVAAHPGIEPRLATMLRDEGAEILELAGPRGETRIGAIELWIQTRQFRRGLARIAAANPDARILVPSAGPAMLWAVARLPRRDAARTLVQLLGPDRMSARPASSPDAAPTLRRAAATLRRKGGRIGGQTAICADRLGLVLGTAAEALPMIYDWSRPMPERTGGERARVGTVNLSRSVKEVGIIAAAAEATAGMVDWRIHLGLEAGTQRSSRGVPAAGPGIEIVRDVLDEESYAAFIESLDFVVMPYPPEIYAHKGSGVLFEAVANGAVPVVPEGTFMAKMLAGTGVGAVFSPFAPESLVAALRDAVPRRAEMAAAARRLGREWRLTHTASAFLEALDAGAATRPG